MEEIAAVETADDEGEEELAGAHDGEDDPDGGAAGVGVDEGSEALFAAHGGFVGLWMMAMV